MPTVVQFFILFTSILSYIICDDSDYCYAQDKTPYEYFLDWTSYNIVKGPTVTQQGCSPIYVWGLMKHGVRNLTNEQIQKNENLFQLKKDIKENSNANRSALCPEDFQKINSWNNILNSTQNEDLAKKAYTNHEQFASYLGHFIDSTNQKPTKDNFQFQTSEVAGASDSALRFTNKLLESTADKAADNGISVNNTLLKARSNCYKWTSSTTEMDAFMSSPVLQALRYSISNRLGFTYPISFENITAMYESCIIGNALTPSSKPPFCAAFLPQDLKVLEYRGDLKHYYQYGYGNSLSEKMGCLLVRDMVDKLGEAAKGTLNGKKGTFYVADEENVMGMLTKLGLYRDEQPLKYYNYQYQKSNRKWKSSLLSPYTATIHAVLFSCANNEKKVEFYHNENIIKLDSCKTTTDNKCSLDMFLSDVRKTLKEDQCDKDFCGTFPKPSGSSMMNFSFPVTVICLIFSRL